MMPVREIKTTARTERSVRGFTLVETLVALLIVTMVSVIVATGVPSAINAYRNAVASSNAQVALSTVATALRDELSTATSASATNADGSIAYTCGEGYEATIKNGTSPNRGPVKSTVDGRVTASEQAWTLVPNAQLSASQSDQLTVTFKSISFDATNKVFKVYGLCVKKGSSVLARIGTTDSAYYAIKAPYCVGSTTPSG